MKTLFCILTVVLFGLAAVAQNNPPILTTDIHEMNHGGWGTVLNVGADVGDKMTLDVTCDHSDPHGRGMCLLYAPLLQTCNRFPNQEQRSLPADRLVDDSWHQPVSCSSTVTFQLMSSTFRHQIYMVSSPSTGDQFVETQYWWVGIGVHYYLHLTNWEVNNL